ncbi:DUF2953 domain-containing protein [Alkaliphilus serpentinus]|uniref:DUF2953 domain-containing protein n=1 Tax=Alkaliphilus serpentinus TaxID=1482731 RepID=A0A833M6G2_9FIRM|nr:DUF2953 domain-containing protein [Alkaliphilus serpentinus]KAB3527363.1 DUF2953 domain-containing protein [Alkaliphilus serpentinus]
MNFLSGAIFFLLVLLILFIFSNLNISLLALKNGSRSEFVITLRFLWGLLKYRIEIPIVDIIKERDFEVNADVNSDIEMAKQKIIKEGASMDLEIHQLRKTYKKIRLIYEKYQFAYSYLKNKVVVKSLSWQTEIGTEDAAVTATITGILWALKSNIVSYVFIKRRTKNINLNVIPFYGGEKLNTALDCIIFIKIGYIIIAALKMFKIKAKE